MLRRPSPSRRLGRPAAVALAAACALSGCSMFRSGTPDNEPTLKTLANRKVAVDMTLTTPNCPSAAELPAMVENAVASVPGVGEVKVSIVWDPPWDPSRMSDEARVALNMW